MNLDQVITLLAALAKGYWTPGESSLLLAVLAHNLAGVAPTLGDLYAAESESATRTGRNARAALLEGGQLRTCARKRLALPDFAGLLSEQIACQSSGKTAPNSGNVVPESGKNVPEKRNDFSAPSRAAFVVALPEKESSVVSSTELQKPTVLDESARARAADLKTFARAVCKLTTADDDDGISKLLAKHGNDLTRQALEQYAQNYTRRGRDARRPVGQLFAWCSKPETMDPLPANAATFETWLARRAAVTEAKPTAAGLPARNTPPDSGLEVTRRIDAQERARRAAYDQHLKDRAARLETERREAATAKAAQGKGAAEKYLALSPLEKEVAADLDAWTRGKGPKPAPVRIKAAREEADARARMAAATGAAEMGLTAARRNG